MDSLDESFASQPILTGELLLLWQILEQVTTRQTELGNTRQRQAFLENEQAYLSAQLPPEMLQMTMEEAQQQLAELNQRHHQQAQSADEWSAVNQKLNQTSQTLRLVLTQFTRLLKHSLEWQKWEQVSSQITENNEQNPAPDSFLHLWAEYHDLQAELASIRNRLNEWFNISTRLTDDLLINANRWLVAMQHWQTDFTQMRSDNYELLDHLQAEVESLVENIFNHPGMT